MKKEIINEIENEKTEDLGSYIEEYTYLCCIECNIDLTDPENYLKALKLYEKYKSYEEIKKVFGFEEIFIYKNLKETFGEDKLDELEIMRYMIKAFIRFIEEKYEI